MKKLIIFGLILLQLASLSTVAFSGDQDFTLVNKTGVDIHYVFITPHDSKEWGEDVMGKDVLTDGSSVDIMFSPDEKVTYWDIRVEDMSGNFLEWHKFNLKEINTITLKPNGDAEYK